jgi:hypothetical protein
VLLLQSLGLASHSDMTTDFAGGGVFRRKLDQEAAEHFLRDVEARTGWSMAHTLQALREQWDEDAE